MRGYRPQGEREDVVLSQPAAEPALHRSAHGALPLLLYVVVFSAPCTASVLPWGKPCKVPHM